MAKVKFTDDLKLKTQRQTFPKLTGLKKGEKVRIQLMDLNAIEMEWVHNLQAPKVENGQPVFKSDGKHEMEYKGSPLSFGDLSILEEKGYDVQNCPISKMAKEHPDWVDAPKRKFAMHIIQYKTKPGSFELAKPFQVEHKVWVFTEKTFAKLREYQEEWEDLRLHDLYITCEIQQYQQFDITVAPKAAWRENTENGTQAIEIYKAGQEQYPDLAGAIGQKKDREWVIKDLKEIEEAWLSITGAEAKPSGIKEESLDGLLDNDFGKPQTSEAPVSDDSDDLLAALGSADSGSSEEASGGVDDFDSLMAGLGTK